MELWSSGLSGFNTQPPEGGWKRPQVFAKQPNGFNTQPPEGGWILINPTACKVARVSTHSRPKAAGPCEKWRVHNRRCFNTQPPEGGWFQKFFFIFFVVRFNTQPPEGGWAGKDGVMYPPYWFQHTAARRRLAVTPARTSKETDIGFNTQPPEGGWASNGKGIPLNLSFQHTAARRRLATLADGSRGANTVSTHSRPKAAGRYLHSRRHRQAVSTHSRPKAAGYCGRWIT